MRVRNSRVRTKVTALLVSLVALWAFAAWVTLREGVNLLGTTTVDSGAVEPSERLLADLQRERRLTMAALGSGAEMPERSVREQRARTDATLAASREAAEGGALRFMADKALLDRLDEALTAAEGLAATREAVDAGRLGRTRLAAAYNDAIDSLYLMFESVAALDDKEIARDARTLLALSRASENFAREDALMASVLAGGELTPAEHLAFVQENAVARFTLETTAAQLPPEEKAAYDAWERSRTVTQLRELERRLIGQLGSAAPPPVSADEWRSAAESARAGLEEIIEAGGDRLVDRSIPGAVGVVVRLVLAGGLGLVAVIASIVLSITTTRQLLAQLRKLRDAAHELSDRRLPDVVERIGHGEVVDVSKEVPDLDFGDDEIGQVGQAFNTVQHTAVRVAAEQAELRRSIRDILLSLARRTQGLVHRQLTVLDVMERRETDPEELKELFRLDHLAIRMRRNAENLIVLSGSTPARTWRRSVPMLDVVRGALTEVEDYTRVTIAPMGDVVLVGRAVGDVIHLLAELIENAVSFSPPYTSVQVSGQLVANGYVIEIEDRGLGMKPEDLAAANERIADPPEFRITGTARLGLYVVSQLARRHDIQVRLKASPYGGTTVVVLLPQDLVEVDAGPPPSEEEPPPALPRRTVAVAERPATAHNVRRLKVAAEPARTPGVPGPRPAPSEPPQDTRPAAEPRESAEPEEAAPEQPGFTPGGLPMRVPQANLAPALREEGPNTSDDTEEDDERSPEEIRAMMGSLQSGTRLGRSEAAKLMDDQGGDT
ncbi:nitrate- and nitrite sensing domain-containing protein [Nonomuraea sp. NPDC049649]|uniref:sensor histidine kinase n=1 Tax=Nonomuraea sp. NPDC049649 TaxID=3155776 RepID=UPI003438DB7E